MKKELKKKVNIMGMELEEWRIGSCFAHFGVGDGWATLYDIFSGDEGKGHATILLKKAKKYYEAQGKKVGGSVALNERMQDIYKKLNYVEYD